MMSMIANKLAMAPVLRRALQAQTAFKLLALLAIPLLAAFIYLSFARQNLVLAHDEAEHLHVMFALERGERPYMDFLENHPVLPHVLLSQLRQALGIQDNIDAYGLAKSIVVLHFVGCLSLILIWLHRHRRELGLQMTPLLTMPLAVILLGVWNVSQREGDDFSYLWQVRPDWICHFWTLASVLLVLRAARSQSTRRSHLLAVCAGLSAGFATAIMAKSILLLAPALLAAAVVCYRRLGGHWPQALQLRRLVVTLAIFAGVTAIAAAVGIVIEVQASNTTLPIYLTANFKLNSIKHLVQSAVDLSPVNILRVMSGLSFPAAALILGWALSATGQARLHGQWLRHGLFTFIGATLVFNGCLPAFSNGLNWPHYYAPSLLMLMLAGTLVTDKLAQLAFASPPEAPAGRPRWKTIAPWRPLLPLGLCVLIAMTLLNRYVDAERYFNALRMNAEAAQVLHGKAAIVHLPDELLPADLSYLSFNPQTKPLNARAWGYFFMLIPDRKIWLDNYRLGIGPDPRSHWQALYRSSPPDVVLVPSIEALTKRVWQAREMQEVKLAWLVDAVRQDYACVHKGGMSVQVRNSLTGRFKSEGWKTCPQSADNERPV